MAYYELTQQDKEDIRARVIGKESAVLTHDEIIGLLEELEKYKPLNK